MKCCKSVIIKLNSNLDKYKLIIYSYNCCLAKEINSSQKILCLPHVFSTLYIKAVPLNSNYNTTYYFKLEPKYNNIFTLNFKFSKVGNTSKTYTFYLTDKNYGLKLNAQLQFNSI